MRAVARLGLLEGVAQFKGGSMDVLVMLEDHPDRSPVLAHVNSGPAPLNSERPARDVVTLYGSPSPESLALALAAAVESRRMQTEHADAIRHLGLWPERGAVGDAAWRDAVTGQLVTRDLLIPLDVLTEQAGELLANFGQMIRRLLAGLLMPDWPEGSRRAIGFSLTPAPELTPASRASVDALLDTIRNADALAFDSEGD
jgi:hypothetical protein